MGQVIAFPAQPTWYANSAVDLGTAERVFLNGIRLWVEAFRGGEDPLPRLFQEFAVEGVHDAAFSIDSFMSVVARVVRRPFSIHCPHCPDVSLDEKYLLHVASLAQAGDCRLVERVLRTTLLSAEGAAFAVGPLEGLGQLFAGARLFLRPQRAPAQDQERAAGTDGRRLPDAAHASFREPGVT